MPLPYHSVRRAPLHTLLLVAPLIFIAHVAEEAPGFVTWVNAHIDRDITQDMFWTGNLAGLGITLLVVLIEWVGRSRVSAIVALAWLGCPRPARPSLWRSARCRCWRTAT